MSNQIRPVHRVLQPKEPVVLEIAVESAVETFTWVILNKRGTRVASGEQDRRQAAGRPMLGPEFSVTVKPTPSVGDYQVRLYQGVTSSGGRPTPEQLSKLKPLDDDAFTIVANARAGGASETTDVGTPLRVALVREGPTSHTAPERQITFKGFREFLGSKPAVSSTAGKANEWPAFGTRPYRVLRDDAHEYVKTSKISTFDDLLPTGYPEGKLKETDKQFPGVNPRGGEPSEYLPGVELIWNYWLEEGMLVQTLNVILARFQNRRLTGRDPLSRFDITPLLPLRNRLWGYAEDEVNRLTVRRRAAEYEYEYGFPLIGRAVPRPATLVERRTGFLETFHQILFLAHRYFKELDDLTVQADAFPLYRALRDCHIVLSQGTQNQYGEMAVAAREEFLVMQAILAEPQMREFLGGRPMTPYPEAETWMDRVDTMKSIQGWGDTSIMHFNDLATIGEQLVLTIRLGAWADTDVGSAANWAQALRNNIQQYAAAYRSATGVDLSKEPNAELPSTLLARRLTGSRTRA